MPQRAEPYSMPFRYFFAFLPLKYTISRIRTAPTIPISKSAGKKLGSGFAKAAEKPSARESTLPERSAPGESRTACPTLSKR
ncbi:hypothetical protein BN191_380015 [Clostridioides difficile T61]|nr:hypothetical protein BN169_500046 [Clostridioides difficile E16]CCL67847.1 hypothetical protein BN184_1110056 [Clostridioides difficile T3]CCL94528.1 hypothetical protein BN191_380015 [Clostridioides difficile T61]